MHAWTRCSLCTVLYYNQSFKFFVTFLIVSCLHNVFTYLRLEPPHVYKEVLSPGPVGRAPRRPPWGSKVAGSSPPEDKKKKLLPAHSPTHARALGPAHTHCTRHVTSRCRAAGIYPPISLPYPIPLPLPRSQQHFCQIHY